MSSSPDKEPSSLENQLHQLQNTLSQFWRTMSSPEPQDPQPSVVWGTAYNNVGPQMESAIRSRIWFTYRSGFEPIARADYGPSPLSFVGSMVLHSLPPTSLPSLFNTSSFCTDVGWGCMIRTSQSLLANTMQTLMLGHDYNYSEDSAGDGLLGLFGDNYSCPFSIHNFIRTSAESPLQVKPGEWFGPSAASLSIKKLCDRFDEPGFPKVSVLISESDLYDNDIAAHFASSSQPLLFLFPIRLGIEKVNAYYHPSLFKILSLKQSVGIAGGKPSSSYYFFGYQDTQLLYLDPHHLQAVSQDRHSYHTSKCRTLPISELDPSMLVGLVVRDMDDYTDLKSQLAGQNKIIHFHSQRKKSVPCEDYVKVSMTDVDKDALDDFVNVSDSVSLASEEEPASRGETQSASYDIVEIPQIQE